MNKDILEKVYELKKFMEGSKKTLILTGAGISTASGIPDFRSKGTGLWEKIDPMEFLSRDVLLNNPDKYYTYYIEEGQLGKKVYEPNRGHIILKELEEKGWIDGIITQNIDNLHKKAGSKTVYEVHGNVDTGYCITCGDKVKSSLIDKKVLEKQVPPRCDKCGGVLRTSVILFGDSLDDSFELAYQEAIGSDLIIVIGSSLNVAPVNGLVLYPKKLAIINREETQMDARADLLIKGDANVILEELIKIV